MSSIRSAIDNALARGEKAMGLFLTSGFPEPAGTLPVLRAIAESGADFVELGMPFSDPLAEGLPIQHASEYALSHGIRMADTFRTVEHFRRDSATPAVLMGYINPILRYGISNFLRDARSSGVDGLILADLPPEESSMIDDEARAVGLDLIYLIAPNTPDERVREIDERSSGFVYAVSVTGVTGSHLDATSSVEAYLEHAKSLVHRNPLLVGFGISSHEDALRLSRHTDGFIVGSALIRTLDALWKDESLSIEMRLDRIRTMVRGLKYGREDDETMEHGQIAPGNRHADVDVR